MRSHRCRRAQLGLASTAAALILSAAALADERPPEVSPPSASDAAERQDDPAYDATLRALNERITSIKERIFNMKTRFLRSGQENQGIESRITDSRARLVHSNDMGAFFTLTAVTYHLDHRKIYFSDNGDGRLAKLPEFEVYNGSVLPGNHLLTVELTYRGQGAVFSYLDGYTWTVKSSYTFFAAKGRQTEVRAIGFERGGLGTALEDRPALKYEVKVNRTQGL